MALQSTFSYRARDKAGQLISGSLEALDVADVNARLRAEGKTVLSITDKPMRAYAEVDADTIRRGESAKRVRRDDVIAFCQQLAVMLETGVPMSEALEAYSTQSGERDFQFVLAEVREQVTSGESLSSSLAKWPRVFPVIMISLVKASEASGSMAMMLGRIGQYLRKEQRTMRQIKGALSYPMFMIGTALLLSVFLIAYVLPRFATIYSTRDAALPVPTQVLLTMSNFLSTQWMFYMPVLIMGGIGAYIWSTRPAGKAALDWMRLHTPLVGGMYRQLYITRSTRTMATLLSGGVNLLDIIDICRGVTNNRHFDRLWTQVESGIRDGRQISDAMIDSPYITPNVASMIAAGEKSGRMSEVMEKISDFTEDELDATIKQVTSYIEPIMILGMGLIIGGVALALLLPVFTMGRVVAGG